jgi:hypothetical protein
MFNAQNYSGVLFLDLSGLCYEISKTLQETLVYLWASYYYICYTIVYSIVLICLRHTLIGILYIWVMHAWHHNFQSLYYYYYYYYYYTVNYYYVLTLVIKMIIHYLYRHKICKLTWIDSSLSSSSS